MLARMIGTDSRTSAIQIGPSVSEVLLLIVRDRNFSLAPATRERLADTADSSSTSSAQDFCRRAAWYRASHISRPGRPHSAQSLPQASSEFLARPIPAVLDGQ